MPQLVFFDTEFTGLGLGWIAAGGDIERKAP